MKIVLDLRCLETPSGRRGVGRYARELASSLLLGAPPGLRLGALSFTGVGSKLGLEDLICPGPRRGIGWTDRFVLPALLKRHGTDLYHSTAYALPSGGMDGVALVLTVHDLVADVHPEALSLRHRLAFRRTFRSARLAQRVVTVSEATRRDLLARYRLEDRRVIAIPNGVAGTFVSVAPAVTAPSGFPRPFLLYVGGLDPLKNVPFLLEVLRHVHRTAPEMHLVVAGEEGARRAELTRLAAVSGLSQRVHAVGFVEDARLAAAYREAATFVFPSRYEGFGLPPLEAMASGCPVVSSPAGALAEVLQDAALLCDPDDALAWARAVLALVVDADARKAVVATGLERAAGFTWPATAKKTLAVYESALREVGRA